jgi:hypothetical protein
MYTYNKLKSLKTQSILNFFKQKDTFILIFSCFDFSDKNVKSFKLFLQKKNIKLYFIKTSHLKEVFKVLPGFHNIKGLLNGPIYIGISDVKSLSDFSLSIEKKQKFHILGVLYNQSLYKSSFVKYISSLTHLGVFSSLVSVLLQNQNTLQFLLTEHLKKN